MNQRYQLLLGAFYNDVDLDLMKNNDLADKNFLFSAHMNFKTHYLHSLLQKQ